MLSRASAWCSDLREKRNDPNAETSGSGERKNSAPTFIEPQLCALTRTPPTGARWVHEVKLDGYRAQMRVESGKVTLRTRKGLDWTARFPEIAAAGGGLPDCILDGEICALDDEGLPDFAGLLAALSDRKTGDLVYFVFDILYGDDDDLRLFALEGRKRVLADLVRGLKKSARARIRYVDHLTADGREAWESACQLGLEGIVSKRVDAPYKSGRVGFWTKTKCRLGQEVVIGGWSSNGGTLRSLLVGAYREGRFVYLGNVGTGFNARNLPSLLARLKECATDERPFQGPNAPKKSRDITWTKPVIVCEVAFATWTREGLLRQASFKGLREDKLASEVIVESASR
jgi:bifunctional non-homologous end joining protein LigD